MNMEQQSKVKDVEPEYEYEDDSISDGEESIVLTSQKTGIRHGQADGKALTNGSQNLFCLEDARGPTPVSPNEEQLQDLHSPNRQSVQVITNFEQWLHIQIEENEEIKVYITGLDKDKVLDDKTDIDIVIMNYVTLLLKYQFECTEGMLIPQLLYEKITLGGPRKIVKVKREDKAVQIHFLYNHFVVSAQFDGLIYVFDSLDNQEHLDCVLSGIMPQLGELYEEVDIERVNLVVLQSQETSNLCGCFAAATAFKLLQLHHTDYMPTKTAFKTSKMRQHLHTCLEKMEITAFPEDTDLEKSIQLSKSQPQVIEDVSSSFEITCLSSEETLPSLSLGDELNVIKASENRISEVELAVKERELDKRVQKRKHSSEECQASENSKKQRARSSGLKYQTNDPIRSIRDRFFPEKILTLHGFRFKMRCELELEDESEYPKLIETLRAETLVDCAIHGPCMTDTSEKVISKKVPSEYSVALGEDQHGNEIGNATHTEGNKKADRDETFESDQDTFCTVGKTSSVSGNEHDKPDLIDNNEIASKLSASIVAHKKVNANLDNGGQSSGQRYIKSTDFSDVSEAEDEDVPILNLSMKNQDEGCHTDTPPPSFCHPEINYNTQERGTMENDALNSKSDESEHIAESLLPNLSPIVEGFQPSYKTDNRNSSQTKEVKEKLKIKLQAKNSSVEVSHPVMIENIKTEISDSSFNIVQNMEEDNPLYGGDDPDKGTQKMIQQENKLLPKTFNVVNIKSASFDKQSPLKPYQRRLLADTVNNALNQIDSTSDESEHMAETPNISHIVQGFPPNYPTDQRNSPKTETPCGEEVKRQLKKMLQAKNPSVELSQTVMIENIKTEILDGPFNIVQDNEEATLLYGYGGPGGMIVNDNTN